MDSYHSDSHEKRQQSAVDDQFFECDAGADDVAATGNSNEEQSESFLDASDLFENDSLPIVLSSDAKLAEDLPQASCYAVSTKIGGRIFMQKSEALEFVKRNAGSRFRACQSFEEARYFLRRADKLFSQVAYQQIDDEETDFQFPSEKSEAASKSLITNKSNSPAKLRIKVKVDRNAENSRRRLAAAENCAFKSVTPQQLNAFRKFIEQRNLEECTRLLNENPRYLVAQGDTPTILHESFRYNVLHVAARVDAHEIAALVLTRLRSVAFWTGLYPALQSAGSLTDSPSRFSLTLRANTSGLQEPANSKSTEIQSRAEYAVDMYVNTPEKGAFETPLHLASKFGAVGVCRLLLSQACCDRNRVNKFGETAESLIGSRIAQSASDRHERVAQIRALYVDRYFVALYRSPFDDTQSALISTPTDQFVSLTVDSAERPTRKPNPLRNEPCKSSSPACCLLLNRSASAALNDSLTETQSDSFSTSIVEESPAVAAMRLNAVAGPMDNHSAERFYRAWNSPRTASRPLAQRFARTDSPLLLRTLHERYESLRHAEANCVNHSEATQTQLSHPTASNVPRLIKSDSNGNITGVTSNRNVAAKPETEKLNLDVNVLHALRSDPRRGAESVGRAIADCMHVSWCEFWPFLGRFVDLRSEEGLISIEEYLRSQLEGSADGVVTRIDESVRSVDLDVGDHDQQATSNLLSSSFAAVRSPLSSLVDSLSRLSIAGSPSSTSNSITSYAEELANVQGDDECALQSACASVPQLNAQECPPPTNGHAEEADLGTCAKPLFLSGQPEPDRTDMDVLNALTICGSAKVLVTRDVQGIQDSSDMNALLLDSTRHPLLTAWYTMMQKYMENR